MNSKMKSKISKSMALSSRAKRRDHEIAQPYAWNDIAVSSNGLVASSGLLRRGASRNDRFVQITMANQYFVT